MKALKTSIRPIGNSRGVVIPKPMLVQAGLTDEAEISVEGGAIVLRRPASRAGWAEASRRVADNLQFELNALKPVTQASCNALRERVESTATFRRRLLSRCREEQLASLQQASSGDAVRRLQFFNAEFDVEAILADTVALRFKQTCRNAR